MSFNWRNKKMIFITIMDIIWLFRTTDTLRSFRNGTVSSAVSKERKLVFSLSAVLGLVTWTLYLIENKTENIKYKNEKSDHQSSNKLNGTQKREKSLEAVNKESTFHFVGNALFSLFAVEPFIFNIRSSCLLDGIRYVHIYVGFINLLNCLYFAVICLLLITVNPRDN